MNLGELRAHCRSRTGDQKAPFLWTDDEWNAWLNEAEREACICARLLEDVESLVIDVAPGERRYPLPEYVIDIDRIELLGGRVLRGWEATRDQLILPSAPTEAVTLTCHIIRLPLEDMVSDDDTPEIASRWHLRMCDWALRCAYLKQDADAFDQQAADRYEALFRASFGTFNTANVQRKHRRNSPRTTRPIQF